MIESVSITICATAAAKPHTVEWRWVRGHSGDLMNERADKLATAARQELGV